MGPFSLCGSRLDSGACCHTAVQERSALLANGTLVNVLSQCGALWSELTRVYSILLLELLQTDPRWARLAHSPGEFAEEDRGGGYSCQEELVLD